MVISIADRLHLARTKESRIELIGHHAALLADGIKAGVHFRMLAGEPFISKYLK